MVNATVGHNSKLHPYCHCAAQSCISSCVTLEKGVHVGLNATVGDGLHLGQFSTLAMGAVLTRNLPEYQIWAGNPARFLRRTQ
jgi:acetyltransferase-like isoleucine patch superfamily enzyme